MTPSTTKSEEATTQERDPKKAKMLDSLVSQIRKDHGQESLIDMKKGHRNVSAISTGCLPLDIGLGIGGVPRGRIIEIFGPEGSGKTTFIYHLIAQVQKEGGVAAFIDTEHSMDAQYAAVVGVNVEDLLVSQPDYGEQALQICDLMVNSGAVDLVAIDSVAALTPKAELDGQIGDTSVGLQARMMSQAMRKLAGAANRHNTTIVFTNQIREKIGVSFGSPETQPGGRALKFYASQRLDIRRIETLKDGAEAVGNRVKVKVVKNKVAPPYKVIEFDIAYGKGIDRFGSLIDFCLEAKSPEGDELAKLITKSGSFFKWNPTDTNMGQGKARAKEWLAEHPDEAGQIEETARRLYLPSDVEGEDAVESSGEVEEAVAPEPELAVA